MLHWLTVYLSNRLAKEDRGSFPLKYSPRFCSTFCPCISKSSSTKEKIFMLTASLFVVILWCAIQDIAVDGWWVTIVKPENLVHAGSAQLIGLEIGSFISTTVFIALNSVEFWNNYIYSIPHSEPILNEISYMKWWAIIFLLMSAYTFIFSSEKKDRVKVEEHESANIKSWYRIIFMMIKNKQLQMTFLIILSLRLFSSLNEFVGKIHLIDDLHYSQSKISIILIICFPLSIISSGLMMKLSHMNMLFVTVIFVLLKWISDIFTINVVFYNTVKAFVVTPQNDKNSIIFWGGLRQRL